MKIVRTSPLLPVRWLFPVKKNRRSNFSIFHRDPVEASRSGTTARTGSPRTISRSIWISAVWLARENNFLFPPPLPPRIDGRPSRHYSQCCVCCTFFFHSSSLPDLLSEIKLTVGEVSHDLTQLVLTFRWVNCITDFTVSSTRKSVNQCSLIWSKNKQLLPGQRNPRKQPHNPLKTWKTSWKRAVGKNV